VPADCGVQTAPFGEVRIVVELPTATNKPFPKVTPLSWLVVGELRTVQLSGKTAELEKQLKDETSMPPATQTVFIGHAASH
jgi:hypothetical protein